MKRLVIRTYWNKIDHSYNLSNPFLKKVLVDEYELKSTTSYPQGDTGYQSFEEMKKEMKKRFPKQYMGCEGNAVKMDLGKFCGIHSYQLITLE